MEICPVGIEHPTMIVQMRRHLVERDEMDKQLRDTFGMIADRGNSFGESARQRGNWTAPLEFEVKIFARKRRTIFGLLVITRHLIRAIRLYRKPLRACFKPTGLDFAILRESEHSAGNDVRRAGEEGLFEALVEHNQAAMAAAQPFTRMVQPTRTATTLSAMNIQTLPIPHQSTIILPSSLKCWRMGG